MLEIQKKLSHSFLAILSLPATAVGFGLSAQIAALSWILKTQLGLDMESVTLVWIAGPLAGLLGQPIVGMISDKLWFMGGRRKPFILIGGLLGALMFLALPQIGIIQAAMPFASLITIATIVTLLLDLSINITFNPARSIIADVTPEGHQRTKAYSWMQTISGTISIFAYFISIIWGNLILINVTVLVMLLCATLPLFFIKEPRELSDSENSKTQEINNSFSSIFKQILPLYGYLIFALYLILNKVFFHETLDAYQTQMMFIALAITIFLGLYILQKNKTDKSDAVEFQKIMLAHSFTWLGIQSMFVMSFFFVQDTILKNVGSDTIFANYFSTIVSGSIPNSENTAGNILSLGFLVLNFVGTLFPVLVLEPMSKKLGRTSTYITALSCMILGYLYLYLFGNQEINFYIGMFICGIGWSAVISIVFAIMTETVSAKTMGLFMGLFNYSVVLPQMMTVGISRILKDTGNMSNLYLFCGGCIAVSCFFWLFVKRQNTTTYN
jgi:maltose/moltooligosaccharide transporter